MEFWNALSEALKQKGFSDAQIKKLIVQFGALDAAALLSIPSTQLLAAMDGSTPQEKRERLAVFLAMVKAVQARADDDRTASERSRFIVSGRILSTDGTPLSGVVVRAVDRDIGREAILGETVTDAGGNYSIPLFSDKFLDPNRNAPHLMIRAFSARARLLGESDIVFNAAGDLKIDLKVEPAEEVPLSAYETLMAKLTPLLRGIPPADLSEQDAKILAAETGANLKQIESLRRSHRLSRETDLPPEICYALAATGISLDVETLLLQDDAKIHKTLETALKKNVIQAMPNGALDGVLARIEDLRVEKKRLFRHTVGGHVRNRENGKPIAGHTVRIIDLDARPQARERSMTGTNPSGEFRFAYTAPPGSLTERMFRLHVLDRQGKELRTVEVKIKPGQKKLDSPIDVALPVIERPSPKVTELDTALDLNLPIHIHQALVRHKIATLDDIRRTGGLDRLKDEDLPADDPAVKRLQAQTDLSILSDNIRVNNALIDKGYDTIHAISRKTRRDFTQAMRTAVGEAEAEKLYRAAKDQSLFLDNLLTKHRVDRANGYAADPAATHDELDDKDKLDIDEIPCSCRECESAVSPLAYLADLLDYAVQHVKDGDSAVTLSDLESFFHQPFGDLPASCESAEEPIRQARLAVEVLRSLLDQVSSDPNQAVRVQEANRNYTHAAYQALLLQVGTSYDELRSVRQRTTKERKDLEERLAIAAPGNVPLGQRIEQLWLDAEKPYPDPHALNEINLERLFGLPATSVQSRFSKGAKLGDTQDQIRDWRLEGIAWLRNTDESGRVHVRLTKSGTKVFVKLYRSQAKNDETLVASGSRTGTDGPVSLMEENFSGLSAMLTLHYTTPTGSIAISAVADFLSWRLAALRLRWIAEAYPRDDTPTGARVGIDPDLIGPDDFRRPEPGNPAFDIWLDRRAWVDVRLTELQARTRTAGNGQIVPDMEAMLEVMATDLPAWHATTIADLEALQASLQNEEEAAAAAARIERLLLTADSLRRFLEIHAKAGSWEAGAGEIVSEAEWGELFSILVETRKRATASVWSSQERGVPGTLFSMEYFWPILREPEEGVWPPTQVPGRPLIDPDTVKDNDLPDAGVGDTARALLEERRAELAALAEQLQAIREASGLVALLADAFGPEPAGVGWLDALNRLNEERMSIDTALADAARERISGDLCLSEAEFGLLMTVKAKDVAGQNDGTLAPKPEEWASLYTILTRVKKEREKFPPWAAAEENLVYWRLRKARLPRWRASVEARRRRQAALAATTDPPVIDPDLVEIPDFIIPFSANAAFGMRQARAAALDALKTDLAAASGASPREKIDQLLRARLGLGAEHLETLAEDTNDGNLTAERLAQLTVSRTELKHLLHVRDLAGDSPAVPDEEWNGLFDILVQVEKRRRLFPQWRLEERDLGLVIGPDHFKSRPPEPPALPPLPQGAQNAWRTQSADRRHWERTLQARIAQQESVIQALNNAVGATEAATLPDLRDHLIAALSDPDKPLSAATKEIGKRMLIDTENSGCQMTTRAGQAMLTVQILLWSLRTGQIEDAWPNLSLDADAFDEEWKWLGAYGTWRAAMMVFLYPENVLWPGLRRHKTGAFKRLSDSLRAAVDLTDTMICDQVNQYSVYFRDVSGLSVEATCMAGVRLPSVQCGVGGDALEGDKTLFFMFGRGQATGRVYWSAYDPENLSDAPQTFWEVVPETASTARILGARVHRLPDGRRWLYLFALRDMEEGRRLAVSRCDLDEGLAWQSPETLEGPGIQWDAVMRQTNSESRPVEFLFSSGGLLYYSALKDAGNGWAGDTWTLFSKKANTWLEIEGLPVAFVNDTIIGYRKGGGDESIGPTTWNNTWHFLDRNQNPPNYSTPAYEYASFFYLWDDDWLGAWPEPEGQAFIFFRNKSNGAIRYRDVLLPGHQSQESPALAGMDRLAVHCGSGPQGCMGHRCTGDGTKTPATVVRRVDLQSPSRLSFGNDHLVTPEVYVPVVTTGDLSGFDVDIFWWTVNSLQGLHARWSWETNMAYLDEAFYYIPLQIALELQQRGRYVEAMDWFRNLYDYTRKGRRVTYAGLDNTFHVAGTADLTTLGTDWLTDPLNLHALARVRPNADLRFVLMSLIRCLLAYGDTEFARDTAESLPRARRLYELARDLLDAAPLNQHAPCEEIVPGVQKSAEGLDVRVSDRLSASRRLAREAAERLLSHDAVIGGARGIVTRWGGLDEKKTAPGYAPVPSMGFCIPLNPVPAALRFHAELNLYKLRTCRNIAGMERDLEPYAAPTDAVGNISAIGVAGQLILPGAFSIQPTQYRYRVLVERTKQLVGIAQQMEATFLSLLEKADAERYTLLRARQDARMARAGVRLQDLRVQESENGVTLAAIQQERALIQKEHFAMLLQGDGLSEAEIAGMTLMATSGILQGIAALGYFALAGPAAVISGTGAFASGIGTLGGLVSSPSGVGAAGGGIVAAAGVMALGAGFMAGAPMILGGLQSAAGAAGTFAGYALTLASFERRRQEWEFQRQMADHDIRIGAQQVNLAGDRVRIAGQEREIAKLQADHTDEVIEFLTTKFTRAELYDWMSGVMEGVYRYFLQQATVMARLAENQLAFERQEMPPALIQADYWEASRDDGRTDAGVDGSPDRRGLTGSSRLLRDIYRLDQYAFETDRRKLQLTKTISLARLDPFAFQQLRETGVMVFGTPMALFDRDFPGHYLRLIKRVRTSVIALIPPVEGIKATLSTAGISRAVIGGDLFQTILIQREPESVALTSPLNATGLFELEAQGQGDMLLPFEGLGVDTTWEFRLPKPANAFDFRTIADVLVTLNYTALDSPTYRQQVIRQLDRSTEAERAFSLRHQFPDAWYDLHHPDLAEAPHQPMRISFATRPEDFPPNITALRIAHVTLYIARKPGIMADVDIDLNLVDEGGPGAVGGSAATVNGVASTRQGTAAAWTAMIGKPAAGTWTLVIQDTPETRRLFSEERIEDIFFVITFSGVTDAWPA